MADTIYYANYIIERDKKDVDLTWTWFVGKTRDEIESEINAASPYQSKAMKTDRSMALPLIAHNDAKPDGVFSSKSRYGMRDISSIILVGL